MRAALDLSDSLWSQLLPAHRTEGDGDPSGVPRCLASLNLREGLDLAIVTDDDGQVYPVPLTTTSGRTCRAVAGDGAAEALVDLFGTQPGPTDGFVLTSWRHTPAYGERAITVDQTNESIVVGESAVVKWSVIADVGPHPAPSVLAMLNDAQFVGTPAPWGALEWEGRLLALVVGFVPGAVDGWTWAVDDIASLDLARIETSMTELAQLVAAFHAALGTTSRPATPEEITSWSADAVAELDRALSLTRRVLPDHADAVRAILRHSVGGPVSVQRVHGDLHVGQVLRAPGHESVITDFDGNPVLEAGKRLELQPVELDIAGLAQSITHAGIVVSRHRPHLHPEAVAEATAHARAAFLSSCGTYDETLIRALAIRQVCREFTYAATHLPRWSYVPEAALPMLLAEDLT